MNLIAKLKRKPKSKILIFGTGKGAETLYHSNKNKYSILGFVDNNQHIQGSYFFRKKVHAPEELLSLCYDKIIIASDYYKEIKVQLTEKLHIEENLIEIFSYSNSHQKPWLSGCKSKAIDIIEDYVCNHSFPKASLIFNFASRISNQLSQLTLTKILWLDNLKSHKIKIFRKETDGLSFPPKISGKKCSPCPIKIPEISLFEFEFGKIMTTVNGVVFGDEQVALTRVPSYSENWAQYSAGFLKYHGKLNALIKNQPATPIKQGIAIIGSSDTNYYHWIIEVLCKLQFISELPNIYHNFPILISEQVLKIPSIKEYITHLNINKKFIYLNSCNVYEVEKLLFINSANYLVTNLKDNKKWTPDTCFVREESLSYLREAILSQLNQKTSPTESPTRIFLARKGIIRDYNQEEVLNLLQQYNFEAIYLEDYDLLQQVALMQYAKVIVGPTGAAWTNLIFCKPKTKALCWMAEEYGELACFSNLAKFSEVDMHYIHYKVDENNSRELYYANYGIDLITIKLWLENNL